MGFNLKNRPKNNCLEKILGLPGRAEASNNSGYSLELAHLKP